MNTINIDPIVLEKAQRYAQENDLDLSDYIEKQLKSLYIQEELFGKKRRTQDLDALLDSITGVLPEMTENSF